MNDKKIQFNKLSTEDAIKFKQYSKKLSILCTIFFIILFPIFIILCYELNQKGISFILKIVLCIIYFLFAYCSYIIYFLGKPKGVKYGKISKINVITLGKYRGYKYNICLEEVHQTIENIRIWPSKKTPVIQKDDSVIIFKTWLGALVVFDEGKERTL